MDLRLAYALILSMLPVSELRGGLPLAILYAKDHSIPILLVFSAVVLSNIIVIFFIFFFLDNFNHALLKINVYRKFFENHVQRIHKRTESFEGKHRSAGFLTLVLLTAVPIPIIGGAWTTVLFSWLLNLNRKKSILAISLGVLIAGVIVLLATLGIMKIFS
ncbi:MAG TPA: small multi-drug export protein [Patescibacteria group bacterium]|nr:small multi-drug export protein [Patescibacteria group bacterium]